jgi:glutathione S-transferase
MIDFVLYGVPGSPFARSVQVGLEEKGASYRFEAVDPRAIKDEAYLRLHPFGRVPAFAHGNFRLYETQAILRYLDDVLPEPPFEPADPAAAARMNQIVGINDWYFFPKAAAAIVGQRIVGPVLLGMPTDEAVVADALPMAHTCVDELNRLLGENPFLAGDQFTLADIMLAPQVDFFAATPEGSAILKGTKLAAWLDRMNARSSMRATLRPEPLRGMMAA